MNKYNNLNNNINMMSKSKDNYHGSGVSQTPSDNFTNPIESLSSQVTQTSTLNGSWFKESVSGLEVNMKPSNPARQPRQRTPSQHQSLNRHLLAMKLIEEVNSQMMMDDYDNETDNVPQEGDIDVVPHEMHDGVSSLFSNSITQTSEMQYSDVLCTESNNVSELPKQPTRAQLVPMSQTLAPAFKSSNQQIASPRA